MILKGNSNLPEAPDNGFEEIPLAELLRKAVAHGRYVTVTIWDVSNGAIDYDTGEQTLKLRPRSIEVMQDADADQAVAMHDRVHGNRTGEVTLAAVASNAGDGPGNDD